MVRLSVLFALGVSALSLSLLAAPERATAKHLRLQNRGIAEAAVIVSCNGVRTTLGIAPGAIADVPDETLDGCRAASAIADFTFERGGDSIVALDTTTDLDGDHQRLLTPMAIHATEQCSSTVILQLPLAACKFGTATAAVLPMTGASYSWNVDGGAILDGDGTDRVTIGLRSVTTAAASVVITTPTCVAQGSGAITLRDPFAIHATATDGNALEPVTVNWSFENGTPTAQTIWSAEFGVVTLPADARSYTYTPETTGNKQVILDATIQGGLSSASSRRRAVAKTPVAASTCVAARTVVPFVVHECHEPDVFLTTPASVIAGSSFPMDIQVQPNDTAQWTIVNGTPATATGEHVVVTAGKSGTVDVTVRLTRKGCTKRVDRSIPIIDAPVCANPKAVVTAGPPTCGSAVVNVTFTGTPPFRGSWADGPTFYTSGNGLSRTVTASGNYRIDTFSDAVCAGTSSGVASFPKLRGTATLIGNPNSCLNDTITVAFDGVPPFTGSWNDWTTFTTSEKTLAKTLIDPAEIGPRGLQLWVDDGTGCHMDVIGNVFIHATPKVWIHLDWPADPATPSPYCYTPGPINGVSLTVEFANYGLVLPLTVEWSDGVRTVTDYWPNRRVVFPEATTTYSIVNAHDAWCKAEIAQPRSFTIAYSPRPEFDVPLRLCNGVTGTATLSSPVPPGATIAWSVQNGTLVSGQGTPAMQYTMGNSGNTTVACTFTYSDARCPVSASHAIKIDGIPDVTFTLPPSIHAGDAFILGYSYNDSMASGAPSDSMMDMIEGVGGCNGTNCQAKYISSHGPGVSTITFNMIGQCGQKKSVSKDLLILP